MERVILHVDGDGFFAGCEIAKDPTLEGSPVVVGRERGMAIAMNYIAKDRGVKRGMAMFQVRKICPDAVILNADHETYQLFSARMNNIIERFSTRLDRYSIDESFADITTMPQVQKTDHEGIARALKQALRDELGMTFSVGVGPTKVLAKLGSKHQKPDGLTIITKERREYFLRETPIEKIWGIGPHTAEYLKNEGIFNALQFTQKSEHWVTSMLAKPYHDIWNELRGVSMLPLNTGVRAPQQSLLRTRTFTPPNHSRAFLFSELSRHTEVVCARAREQHLAGSVFSFFLKTQGFKFYNMTFKLTEKTNTPEELIALITQHIDKLHEDDTLYRATGVTLGALSDSAKRQPSLFDQTDVTERREKIHKEIDHINAKFGEPLVHLASSTHLLKSGRASREKREKHMIERLDIPLIGSIE